MVETKVIEITELLIVKAGADYIRFTEGGFERCAMNRGAVFPLSQAEDVKRKCDLFSADTPDLQLVKLSIYEEPYTG